MPLRRRGRRQPARRRPTPRSQLQMPRHPLHRLFRMFVNPQPTEAGLIRIRPSNAGFGGGPRWKIKQAIPPVQSRQVCRKPEGVGRCGKRPQDHETGSRGSGVRSMEKSDWMAGMSHSLSASAPTLKPQHLFSAGDSPFGLPPLHLFNSPATFTQCAPCSPSTLYSCLLQRSGQAGPHAGREGGDCCQERGLRETGMRMSGCQKRGSPAPRKGGVWLPRGWLVSATQV